MGSRLRRSWFLVLTVVSLAIVLHGSQTATPDVVIEGLVLEYETQQPLEGVRISLTSNGVSMAATTDMLGRFAIQKVPPGRHRIEPRKDGFFLSRLPLIASPREPWLSIQTSAEAGDQFVQVEMVRTGVISGQVLDAKGQPFASEKAKPVNLATYTYDEYGQRKLNSVPGILYPPRFSSSSVLVNDRGEYRFYGLPPGEYFVYVGASIISSGPSTFIQPATYYPGSTDSNQALPVRVRSGDEVRLTPITLGQEETAPVRFLLKEPPDAPDLSSVSSIDRVVDWGQGTADYSPIRPGSELEASRNEIAIPFIRPGRYDFLVSLRYRLLTGIETMLFGRISLTLGNSSSADVALTLRHGLRLTGGLVVEDIDGKRRVIPASDRTGPQCRLRSDAPVSRTTQLATPCFASMFVPGTYRLEMINMPPDAFVLSAKVSGKDALADEGIEITDDNTPLEIVIAAHGSVIAGHVKNSTGGGLSAAVVALVPNEPFRKTYLLYRSDISDVNGYFELRGIAPGDYHLFAWQDIAGAAFKNAEFMMNYKEKGRPITVERDSHIVLDNVSALQ